MFFFQNWNNYFKFFNENGVYLIHVLFILIICCFAVFVKVIRCFIYLMKMNKLPTRTDPLPIENMNKRHVLAHEFKYSILLMSLEILSQAFIKISIKSIYVYPYSALALFSIFLIEKYGTYTAVNDQIRTVYAPYFTVIQVGVLRPFLMRVRHAYDRIRHKYGVVYGVVLW